MQCAHLEKYDFVNGKDYISYIKWNIKHDWNILKPPPSLLSHVTASVASSLYWRESFGCWMMLRISFGCWIIMDWWLQDIVPRDQTQLPSAGTCNKRSAKSLELSEVPVTFANKYLVDMTRDQGENLTLKRWDVRCTPPTKNSSGTLRHLLYVTYINSHV